MQSIFFEECGIPTILDGRAFNRRDVIQLACQYLMDHYYPHQNECDVITDYQSISIDWIAKTVLIPVNKICKPVLH